MLLPEAAGQNFALSPYRLVALVFVSLTATRRHLPHEKGKRHLTIEPREPIA
jgi:hypothetical protein